MYDNAHAHASCIAMGYLEEEGIERMDWPLHSQDLTLKEHSLDMLGR